MPIVVRTSHTSQSLILESLKQGTAGISKAQCNPTSSYPCLVVVQGAAEKRAIIKTTIINSNKIIQILSLSIQQSLLLFEHNVKATSTLAQTSL
jgi:hypothetical protein